MNINNTLNEQKIFMFSSVHVWMDTRIFYKEAVTLVNQGYQVEFYAIDNDTRVLDTKVNVHLLKKRGKWYRPFRWFYLYKEALRSDALFYHFHDPELLIVAKALRKKKPGAIIIYDMHEYFPGQIEKKEWIPKWIRKPLSSWVRKKEKNGMKACDAVIFAEKSYAKKHPEYKGEKKEVLNFPTWQSVSNVPKEEKFTFIYVGDIVINRNVFGMLNVIGELKKRGYKNLQLKLIGPISNSLEIELYKYMKKIGVGEEVIFYGRLPYTSIWDHYSRAHVGLCLLYPHPNYLQSMATKIYEYMAASLPCIVSDFPEWAALINKTNSGLTANPHNVSAITDQAEKLMINPLLCEMMGKSGRFAFEQKYNWEGEAKKLGDLYKELVKKRMDEKKKRC